MSAQCRVSKVRSHQPERSSLARGVRCGATRVVHRSIPLIEAEWFLPEVHRALSRRGIFIGVYINGQSLRAIAWRIKHRLLHGQNSNESVFYRSSYSKWKSRLLGTGFEMLHEESCCWGPFSRNSNSPFVPAVAKMERALRLHRVVTSEPLGRVRRSKTRPRVTATARGDVLRGMIDRSAGRSSPSKPRQDAWDRSSSHALRTVLAVLSRRCLPR